MATGGIITYVNNQDGSVDEVHTFTSSGSLVLDQIVNNVQILVIGGGGGGGFDARGGGGAGGAVSANITSLSSGTYTITVGAGGAGGGGSSVRGYNGNPSLVNGTGVSITAYGGGGGGSGENGNLPNTLGPTPCGCGGGNGYQSSSAGGAASKGTAAITDGTFTVYGNAGGKRNSSYYCAGGGGGLGAVGSDATSWNGGSGGDGLQFDISGSTVWYGGGGAGGNNASGGQGGGGKSSAYYDGGNGIVNTGSGGGCGGYNSGGTKGGDGGSGIVIVRFAYQPVSQLGFLSFKPRRNRGINLVTSFASNQNCNFLTSRTPRAFKTPSQTVIYDFDYTGSIRSFTVPFSGTYQLECWGAQGGSSTYPGGYGGYSTGLISLTKGETLYLGIGGVGTGPSASPVNGGYNGGGSVTLSGGSSCSGGGCTHIATVSGELKQLQANQDAVLIVAGGGGGATSYNSSWAAYSTFVGGNGGGFQTDNVQGGSSRFTDKTTYAWGALQTGPRDTATYSWNDRYNSVGSFGQGGDTMGENSYSSAGGGGWYGGGGGFGVAAGAGGSGYIGNSNLFDKYMVGYNVETSDEESTKTISNNAVNSVPTSDFSKIGNGFARITLQGDLL